ncbi:MAG TPA: hypothetical protein VEC37_11235, partial [Bacillota bacterium]|nr:hypothetical protein [Bacillota bacterium]
EGGIDLAGNTGSSYSGTIYAPGRRAANGKEKCNFGGNSQSTGGAPTPVTNISISSNLICSTINVGGTSNVSIYYKEEQNYRRPPMVELIH